MNDELSQWLVVIPARLGSTRLPEKALADIAGKPLVVRTFERTKLLQERGAQVVVATDSEKIVSACQKFSLPVQMTSVDHQSGTDRCFEVSRKYPCTHVMNVQGDEPFIDSQELLNLARLLMKRPFVGMATLAAAVSDANAFRDPNVVKVVISSDQRALYFSRSPIPWMKDVENLKEVSFWAHVGIYAFRREALGDFVKFPKSSLELCENLEQLRALENGMEIIVERSRSMTLNINTPEDLKEARRLYAVAGN